jgi:hypothetical protein
MTTYILTAHKAKKEKTMTTAEAKKAGVEAYRAGMNQAPALNQAFITNACAADEDTVELVKAYSDGWTYANLADGVEDESMPSVQALREIEIAVQDERIDELKTALKSIIDEASTCNNCDSHSIALGALEG